ncbi:hypothetical protein NECAME_12772 [Necator americanus]|uniref:Uncharacterized protein n=1 Tax=Necator americanus TaxID=51031 RepID=W2SYK2_NECAM|nr:hypothetical protein NECAME_12772 [Necator americanus]ETN74725.1 hypothetical protein NECAME_12772 [Necator americanus]
MMLTSRYQIRENIATTKIATYLVGFQTILFLSYTVFGSIVYSYRKRIFGDNLKAFTAARQALYLMPLFTFSLPIFTIILIRRYRSHRSEQIRSIVSLRSTGNEGSRNYGEIMLKIWEKSSK